MQLFCFSKAIFAVISPSVNHFAVLASASMCLPTSLHYDYSYSNHRLSKICSIHAAFPARIYTIPANLYQLQRIMKQETAARLMVMILGLFIMSLGIAFSTKAGLGTTPISCVPYVLSQGFPLSFGTFTFLMNSLFVVFQYFLLKDRFETYQWLQIPLIFVFSVFTDLSMILVSDLIITGYIFQWVFCLISCILVAFGIALLLKANLLMMAGDALVRALSLVSKIMKWS